MDKSTPPTKPRLLMISTDPLVLDEGSAVAIRQAEYAKSWDEVHIVVFSCADRDGTHTAKLASNCFAYATRSKSKWHYVFDALRIGRSLVSEKGITEITCQDPFLTAAVGTVLKRRYGFPLEIQIHADIGSPYYPYKFSNRIRKMLAGNFLPKADKIRVVSSRIARHLVSVLNIPQSKITVRPIAVDVQSVRDARIIVDLHDKYPQFKKIALMASRIEPEKNIILVIKAWPAVVARIAGAGLVIVGRGSLVSELKSTVSSLGLDKSVVFEDWVSPQILASYYKTADVFLNTSLFEGYGMTLVEAAAAGCPVISTDVGVAKETGARTVGYNENEVAEAVIRIFQ